MMMSRIETVLNPGINAGLSPYLRITTPGQGLVSVPVRASVVCAAASRTSPAEASASPIFNADLLSIPFIDVLPNPIQPSCQNCRPKWARCTGSLHLPGSSVQAIAGDREVPKLRRSSNPPVLL